MQPTPHQEWEDALDALEVHIAHAETLVLTLRLDEVAPWSPPQLSTPMPGYLVDRAQTLLGRLETVHERIPELAERVRRERAVAERISRATAPPRRPPVYVDENA
jgi:hypothetical protein